MSKAKITEKPMAFGEGVVLFRRGKPVANLIRCMDHRTWSVRVSGARFEANMGQRFLSGRRYTDLTYVAGKQAARDLALTTLLAQRRHQVLPIIYQHRCRHTEG